MRRYAVIAITVLGLFCESSAALKIAKGDDKCVETANPGASNKMVEFVSKVHEPGLPLKCSTYLMKGTAATAVPGEKCDGSLVVARATVAYRVPRTNWLGTNFCVAAAQDVASVLGRAVGREIACIHEESLPAGTTNVIYVGDTVAAESAGLASRRSPRR